GQGTAHRARLPSDGSGRAPRPRSRTAPDPAGAVVQLRRSPADRQTARWRRLRSRERSSQGWTGRRFLVTVGRGVQPAPASDGVGAATAGSSSRRGAYALRRRALLTTNTLDRPMAAAAIIGDSSQPSDG